MALEPLDRIAQQLYGKSYDRLSDGQADAVWNLIESSEENA